MVFGQPRHDLRQDTGSSQSPGARVQSIAESRYQFQNRKVCQTTCTAVSLQMLHLDGFGSVRMRLDHQQGAKMKSLQGQTRIGRRYETVPGFRAYRDQAKLHTTLSKVVASAHHLTRQAPLSTTLCAVTFDKTYCTLFSDADFVMIRLLHSWLVLSCALSPCLPACLPALAGSGGFRCRPLPSAWPDT